MRWAQDGRHICVAYDDGMALVGSSTGTPTKCNVAQFFMWEGTHGAIITIYANVLWPMKFMVC